MKKTTASIAALCGLLMFGCVLILGTSLFVSCANRAPVGPNVSSTGPIRASDAPCTGAYLSPFCNQVIPCGCYLSSSNCPNYLICPNGTPTFTPGAIPTLTVTPTPSISPTLAVTNSPTFTWTPTFTPSPAFTSTPNPTDCYNCDQAYFDKLHEIFGDTVSVDGSFAAACFVCGLTLNPACCAICELYGPTETPHQGFVLGEIVGAADTDDDCLQAHGCDDSIFSEY